jgi:uncharacterized membrane protein YecN with MAPEG domain
MELQTPVTALYASLLAILLVVLAGYVVRTRIREKVPLGDASNKAMLRAVRVHANAVENIPIALVLMLLLELNGGNSVVLHAYGEVLFVGRVMHAWGMVQENTTNRWRQFGIVLTWLVTLGLSVSLLVRLAA